MLKKHLTKIQHPFVIGTLRIIGIARNFLNLRTSTKKTKTTTNILLNSERLKSSA